jgi:hydroxymethylpyrimidine/phosphomethylpyrimidine kinase
LVVARRVVLALADIFAVWTVLSIAGLDPSGGAGTLADIKTFAALGCYGTAAITSITSQNTLGVYGSSHQSAEVVRAQLEPIVKDFRIAAVKTGMLPTCEVIEVVAEIIERHSLPNVVVDPVLRSSSGYDLMDADAVEFLIGRLLPLADLITPNMAEAERLTGIEVKDLEGMERAAHRIREICRERTRGLRRERAGQHAVLLKGGHLETEATDLLDDGREIRLFRAPKIVTRRTHGTGCTLSSAIAARLAQGHEIPESIEYAKRYLEAAMRAAPDLGHGVGPINHFWEG